MTKLKKQLIEQLEQLSCYDKLKVRMIDGESLKVECPGYSSHCAFMDEVFKWCIENNVKFTGSNNNIYSIVFSLPDYVRPSNVYPINELNKFF